MTKIGDSSTDMASKDREVDDARGNDITSIGYFGYKPKWMQVFNNPKAFLFFMCCFAFLQGFVVNGITNVNTTSLEKRFNLKSSEVGWVSSAYDVSAGIMVIPVSYFGSQTHKPRVVAIAALLLAIGSIIMSIPHFATGNYEFGEGGDVCMPSAANNTSCVPSNQGLSNYLFVLILGQVIHGLAGTTLYTVGTSTIDDVVTSNTSPVYIGIFFATAALGPAVGFIGGGQLLNLFVDFDNVNTDSLPLTNVDPQWIGAWWLSYIISGCLTFCLAIPLFGYGRELPCAANIRAQRITQTHNDGGEQKTERVGFGKSLRDLPMAAWILLKNPTFLFISFASATEGLLTSGFATFLPKFIQNQYGQSDSFSALLSGIIVVPGAAGGQLLGGIICKVKKLKVRGMTLLCVLACFLTMLAMSSLWANCEQEKIPGITVQYSNTSLSIVDVNLNSACNAKCGCTSESYSPVCADNGVFYFSQCHAGCLSASGDRNELYNCSCVLQDTTYNGTSTTATAGKCGAQCVMLYVFVISFFLVILLTFLAGVPTISITLRCVPNNQRAFSIGLQWVFIRFLGTVPGPVLMGVIIDSTCIQWQEICEERASCWIYDTFRMSMYLFFIAVGFKLLSLIMFFLANMFYKAPPADMHVKSMSMTSIAKSNGTIDSGVEEDPTSSGSDEHKENDVINEKPVVV